MVFVGLTEQTAVAEEAEHDDPEHSVHGGIDIGMLRCDRKVADPINDMNVVEIGVLQLSRHARWDSSGPRIPIYGPTNALVRQFGINSKPLDRNQHPQRSATSAACTVIASKRIQHPK